MKWLQYRLSAGKFPANLEHSQEIIFLECYFVNPEILNCKPVKLEKRDGFAKVFLKCRNFRTSFPF